MGGAIAPVLPNMRKEKMKLTLSYNVGCPVGALFAARPLIKTRFTTKYKENSTPMIVDETSCAVLPQGLRTFVYSVATNSKEEGVVKKRS